MILLLDIVMCIAVKPQNIEYIPGNTREISCMPPASFSYSVQVKLLLVNYYFSLKLLMEKLFVRFFFNQIGWKGVSSWYFLHFTGIYASFLVFLCATFVNLSLKIKYLFSILFCLTCFFYAWNLPNTRRLWRNYPLLA